MRSIKPRSPSDLKILMTDKSAKFGIGAIVKHRVYPFRGVVVDVDPEFDNTDEWYESIPAELRGQGAAFLPFACRKFRQLLYRLCQPAKPAPDGENGPIGHPDVDEMFDGLDGERYFLRQRHLTRVGI